MHRQITLGAADLRADDGRVVTAVLAQPKRLALLVYLAVRDPGEFVQRNSLLAMFWPESDEARARGSLRTALHFLRTELGPDIFLNRGEEVAVNPSALSCDAVAFEQAAKAGRLDDALGLWRGTFLEGFLPSDIPDFLEWLDRRRSALESLALNVARRVSADAASPGDHERALVAATLWTGLAPFDEAAIRACVHALVHSGRRLDAVHALDRWTDRVDRDIGAPPSPEMLSLRRSLAGDGRKSPPSAVAALPIETVKAVTLLDAPAAGAARIPPETTLVDAERAAPRAHIMRRSLVAGLLIGGVVAVVVALVIGASRRSAEPATKTSALAILPFIYTGAPRFNYLREAMPDLLSTRIDAGTGLRTINARAVLAQANRIPPEDGATDVAAGRRVAAALGAHYFVLGSVVEVEGQLSLDATLYQTEQGTGLLARTALAGDVEQLFTLADSMSRVLVRATTSAQRVEAVVAGSDGSGTRSLAALQAFVEGEMAFNQARYDAAAAAYQHAIRADPGFARAHFRLAMANSWVGGGAHVRDPLAEAQRNAQRLSPDDRLLLRAWTEHIDFRARVADSLYTLYLAAHPEDAEAWFQLGEVRMHWGSAIGVEPKQARDAFRRALDFLPDHAASMIHLIRLAGRAGDSAEVAQLVTRLLALGPREEERLEARTIAAIARAVPDTAALSSIVRDATPAGLAQLRVLLPTIAASVPNPAHVRPFAARLVVRGDPSLRGNYLFTGQLDAAAGRFSAAAEATRLLPPALAVRGTELRAMYAALPFAGSDPLTARALRDSVRALPRLVNGRAEIQPRKDGVVFLPRALLLDGLLSLRLGDTISVRRTMAELDDLKAKGRVAVFGRRYAALLRARLALGRSDASGAADALAALDEPIIDRLGQYPDLTSYPLALTRFTRAEALARLGRDEAALRWFDGFPDNSGYDVVFIAPAALAAARIDARHGRTADANRRYAKVLELWSNPDRGLDATVDRIRQEARTARRKG